MKYIDIHTHLNFSDYDNDRDDVVVRIQESEIGVINVGIDIETSKQAIELAQRYENMWATVGIHPMDTKSEVDFDEIYRLAKDTKVVAIGECGLDYTNADATSIARQRETFLKHIDIANKANKPLMLHVRNSNGNTNAYQDVLQMLKESAKVNFNFHFFVGTLNDLKDIVEIGGTVSFTGVITFVSEYDELVKYVPNDLYMIETDAPFVSPSPFRGKRNEPVYVKEIARAIARIKGQDLEFVASQSVKNARRVFGI